MSASGFDFARFCAVGGFPVRSICVVGAGGFGCFGDFGCLCVCEHVMALDSGFAGSICAVARFLRLVIVFAMAG